MNAQTPAGRSAVTEAQQAGADRLAKAIAEASLDPKHGAKVAAMIARKAQP